MDNFYYQLFLNRANIVVLLYSEDYGISGASVDEKNAIIERLANEKDNKWLLPVFPNSRIKSPDWLPPEMAFYNRESEGDEELIRKIAGMVKEYPSTLDAPQLPNTIHGSSVNKTKPKRLIVQQAINRSTGETVQLDPVTLQPYNFALSNEKYSATQADRTTPPPTSPPPLDDYNKLQREKNLPKTVKSTTTISIGLRNRRRFEITTPGKVVAIPDDLREDFADYVTTDMGKILVEKKTLIIDPE